MQAKMTTRPGSVARSAAAIALTAVVAVAGLGCARRSPSPAPTAPLAALQPAGAPEPGPAYRIQVGDELHVRFMYQPDMSEIVPVRPDGRITLASTGELTVVGMMPTELEHLVVERSSSRLRNPEVSVIVTKLGEQRVYVGGEVARPGYVLLRPDMTPLQAVMQSGGFKPSAKLESVLLMTPAADGQFQAARVDMKQVVDQGVPERVRLHPNDVIFVPTTWIADMNIVVDQYVRGLIPTLPRVGVGYSLSNQ
jgi:polysaccharide export outer membrane protein